MKRHRVLVVDDSRSMRMLIGAKLAAHADIQVVGEAGDAAAARQAIKDLAPDVVTLDVEMPGMSGIDFLEKLMLLRPTPVIMVSSHTGAETELTLRALEIGAVDCVAKPRAGEADALAELADKVRMASKAQMRPKRAKAAPPASAAPPYRSDGRIVAIGSSTGGVEALSALLVDFPENGPPTVVTQHMPANFTRSFAARLDRLCAARVEEASDGAPLVPGRIYIAPGGAQHLAVGGGTKGMVCRLVSKDLVNGHRPAVDVLFASLAKVAGSRAVGVILTGMGRDGAQGLLSMRAAGARTLGQDEATSLIYGMPKAAFDMDAVERQLALSKLAPAILELTHRN